MHNYHTSFTLNESQEIQAYFKQYGYVAVRDVLTPQECQNTYNEMNAHMKAINPAFDIYDVNTYDSTPLINNFGLYSHTPLFTSQFLHNRQNPDVFAVFALLYGTRNLLVNHDRCCFYRPTLDKPEWKTKFEYPGLHLDFHPSTYDRPEFVKNVREKLAYSDSRDFVSENNMYCCDDGLQLQGVINLLNNEPEDGGFQCVPGFNYLSWFENFREKKANIIGSYFFSAKDPNDMKYVFESERIAVPKGTLIVWDQKMAHGSRPNSSLKPRACQFIKMYPKSIVSRERYLARQKALRKVLANNDFAPQVNNVGQIVFGL